MYRKNKNPSNNCLHVLLFHFISNKNKILCHHRFKCNYHFSYSTFLHLHIIYWYMAGIILHTPWKQKIIVYKLRCKFFYTHILRTSNKYTRNYKNIKHKLSSVILVINAFLRWLLVCWFFFSLLYKMVQ